MNLSVRSTDAREEICDRFEQLWFQAQLSLQEFIRLAEPPLDTTVVAELIRIELDLLHARGQLPSIENYHSRFPLHQQTIDQAFVRLENLNHTSLTTFDSLHSQKLGEDLLANLPPVIARYRIVRCIGQGAFGVVYKALRETTGEPYALKFPRRNVLHSIEELIQLKNETQLASSLEHPGIIRTIGLETHDRFVFVVQQYVDGVPLSDLEPIEAKQAVELIAKVAQALAYAHEQRLIHRDLKPANIVIGRDGQPKIVDFGLSIHESVQRRFRGQRCGTPYYMSPEQVRGLTHQLDGRSDIWSLGVTMYELLAGARPFQGSNSDEIFDEILHRNEKPLRMHRSELDAEIQRICAKCLSKPIRERYASGRDLAEDLGSWLLTEPKGSSAIDSSLIPRGLKSYRAEDADSFLSLLPGTRNRDGIPDSICFWKSRLEMDRSMKSFSVGALLGPSGSGKSSLIKAGLLPRLNANFIRTIYLECSSELTEQELRTAILDLVSPEDPSLTLEQLLDGIRSGVWEFGSPRLLIVLDQFEQWLVSNPEFALGELTDALRHCDGKRLHCLIIARDDFWLSTSRFVESVGAAWNESENIQRMDKLSSEHAKQVLHRLGHAYGRLPSVDRPLSGADHQFLDEAIALLNRQGHINCVQLALLAEILKDRPWSVRELKYLDGMIGVGERYLELYLEPDSIHDHPSTMLQRFGYTRTEMCSAAESILASILPSQDRSIRQSNKTSIEIQRECDLQDVNLISAVLRWLDRDLRLVTTVESPRLAEHRRENTLIESDETHIAYQLAHEAMIPSIRNWLRRKQRQTWRGRAKLLLEELVQDWRLRRDRRFLPSIVDHFKMRLAVPRSIRNKTEDAFLAYAFRRHGLQVSVWSGLIGSFTLLFGYIQETNRNEDLRSHLQQVIKRGHVELVDQLLFLEADPYRTLALIRSQSDDWSKRPVELALIRIALSKFHKSDLELLSDLEMVVNSLCYATPIDYVVLLRQLEKVFDNRVLKVLSETFGKLTVNSEGRARLAIAMLYLGDTSAAEQLCANHADPTQATLMSHTLYELFPDPDRLLRIAKEHQNDYDLLFGLLVAASRYKVEDWTDPDKWQGFLQTQYLLHPDSGVHGMCLKLADQWGWFDITDPSCEWRHPDATDKPVAGQQWWRVALAEGVELTFVRVSSGSYVEDPPPSLRNGVRQLFTKGTRVVVHDDFWICQTEMPFFVYEYWMRAANPITPPVPGLRDEAISLESRFKRHEGMRDFFLPVNRWSPVNPVSYDEAKACASFFSAQFNSIKKESTFQIGVPKLEQLELALRAGSETIFHFSGDIATPYLDRYAYVGVPKLPDENYAGYARTNWAKIPNRLGIFNLIGNMAEHVQMKDSDQPFKDGKYFWYITGDDGERNHHTTGYIDRHPTRLTFLPFFGVRLCIENVVDSDLDPRL